MLLNVMPMQSKDSTAIIVFRQSLAFRITHFLPVERVEIFDPLSKVSNMSLRIIYMFKWKERIGQKVTYAIRLAAFVYLDMMKRVRERSEDSK